MTRHLAGSFASPPGAEAEGGPVRVTALRAQAFHIPTDLPEADGTFAWNATTLVLVEVEAGGQTGIGYTYSDASIVRLIHHTLAACVIDADAWQVGALWLRMQRQVRNPGRAGLAATAISAVDCALWDLKAKLLGVPLVTLLGAQRANVPIYGSGGFTTYTDEQLREQLVRWVAQDGCRWVKMKIGTHPQEDPQRVAAARAAIGDAGLFVDANGAFSVKEALHYARAFAEQGVEWFEEPVSSDDLRGLALLRERAPARMEIAAGEYAYTLDDFRLLLEAHAVDVLQADVSRCGGVTGFLQAAALCEAFHVPLSAHCAPALHLHVASAVRNLRHQEWFHDHVRIEAMLFDGAPRPSNGAIAPDMARPGCGLAFRHGDAQRYLIH
ncbi:mandelate racemase/muconate lactonizing enzyme-like protein [Paraburkholderia xenovorans LB400]|uniref:Mandelate racemase/muconate lactonizingenzyme n=1 Tax=Paraburkholderia xenovorans (strain LB400) TaxID=266265 RepID=Q13FJ4_PARXL|nr:enolase C-terminal domain-like protein [Paraburkholderia xenovorans]ABE37145.1 putative mandelate racemase/muconate lactonizingenzyme [Paraburkholderia xenovorans LB400]AIP34042.1 mandelate racemase/muconate lactonizing enzyme-like protein [Paraburkholderia xenovorans LB400]